MSNLKILSDPICLMRCENCHVVETHSGRVDDVHDSIYLVQFILKQSLINYRVNLHHVIVDVF